MAQEIITYSILAGVFSLVVIRIYRAIKPGKRTGGGHCASGCGGCALKEKCSTVSYKE